MAVTNIKTYQTFRGVDYSASPSVISEEHASDLLNMYVGADGVMQKRPGWHILKTFAEDDANLPINGIHFMKFATGNGTLFVHAGTHVWAVLMASKWRHIRGEDVPYFQYSGDVPTMEDVQMIRDYVSSGIQGLQEWQVRNMDINGDGRVTEDDAQILSDFIINLAQTASNGVLDSSYTKVKLGTRSDGHITPTANDLELKNTRSVAFEHDGMLYVLDGNKYYRIVPQYAETTNLLDTSTVYDGLILSDGTFDDGGGGR